MRYNPCNIFFRLLLLCLIPDLVRTGDSVYVDFSTYDDARKKCANVSLSLPDPEDDLQHNASFEYGPIHHFWLRVRKVKLKGWMTLSGQRIDEYQDQEHVDSRRKGKDCAVLRTRDQMIDEVYCNKKTKGFICSYPVGVSCLESYQCTTIGTRRVLYRQQMVTWFEAQQACSQLNLTLMEPPKVKIQQFAKKMRQSIPEPGHYAIGMLHSIWIKDTGHKEKDTVTPSIIRWANNEPNPLASCAVVSEVTSLAKAVPCSTKAAYFCVPDGKTEAAAKHAMTSFSTTEFGTTVDQIKTIPLVKTGSGIGVALLSLVVVLFVIIIILVMWNAILTREVCIQRKIGPSILKSKEDFTIEEGGEDKLELLDRDTYAENDECTVNVRSGHVQLETIKVEGDKILQEGLKALHQDEPELSGGSTI